MDIIGVISDTHGLLRPQALAALRGVTQIIHAGDIGDSAILNALAALAPLTPVRGNNDRDPWADNIPELATLEVETKRILVIHDVKQLRTDPAREGYAAVVSGHSHKPSAVRRAGVLFLNPGSAGPRRFSLPISLALLKVDRGGVDFELIELEPR